jgi:pimeloyl-ACP methyl ester carboxylesterase
MNFWRTADVWATLMTDVLGYPRFAAYGADWGAFVSAQLGHKYADRVVGVHGAGALDFWNIERPWADAVRLVLPDDPQLRAEALAWERARASHVSVHLLDPQTLAAALHDSPAGLAAHLLERRRAWSDCGGDLERRFSLDDLVTTVMIYWVTETFATSARFYFEAVANPWTPSHDRAPIIEVPVGYSLFEPDLPPGGARIERPAPARRHADVHFNRVHATGGHFTAAEEPVAVVQDIRDIFRELR